MTPEPEHVFALLLREVVKIDRMVQALLAEQVEEVVRLYPHLERITNYLGMVKTEICECKKVSEQQSSG